MYIYIYYMSMQAYTSIHIHACLQYIIYCIQTYANYIHMNDIGNSTSLLEPALLTSTVLQHIDTLYTFIQLPGIHNCATKMLNGIECGNNNIIINHTHIDIAQDILLRFVYFGITEHFHTSICMMSWLYGGRVHPYHFKVWRKGNYGSSDGTSGTCDSGSATRGSASGSSTSGKEVEKEVELGQSSAILSDKEEKNVAVEELTSEQYKHFLELEKYDVMLYEYAYKLYRNRLALTGCPIIDPPPPDLPHI